MFFLHIMHNDKFCTPFIEMIETGFNINEHLFLIYGGYDNELFPIHKKQYVIRAQGPVETIAKQLLPILVRADKIYLHGLFNLQVLSLLDCVPDFLPKCNWIIWGGDLYELNKSKPDYILRKKLVPKFGEISTLADGDYDVAKKEFGEIGRQKHAQYKNLVCKKDLDNALDRTKKQIKTGTTRIQIGNCASKTHRHEKIFALLKDKFSQQPIEVYVPLSYGDMKYANKLESLGHRLFGNSFYALKKFISPEMFVNFQAKMDIGFFPAIRQQALGNISSLLYLEKKVYLDNKSSTIKHLTSLGFKIPSIQDFETESIKDSLKNDHAANNKNIIINWYDDRYLHAIWYKNFYE